MTKQYIIALDQGTSSSRAIIYNDKAQVVDKSQREFEQIYPKTGWVEHNADEIWRSQSAVLFDVIEKTGITIDQISALGITNQRETTVIWDRQTGEPIYNAIVWQDKRTIDYCKALQQSNANKIIRDKTGLLADAYFSASKIVWLLDNIPNARQRAERGELAFGTVDTWLLWKLTDGRSHATDYSNASRTLLFNIHTCQWDQELLEIFDIPQQLLPDVRPSGGEFGEWEVDAHHIPITGVLGDQQAALFGQLGINRGDTKNTYGTGCFMLLNTADKAVVSQHGLLTTIAWGMNGTVTYALEGSVFIAGAAIQWLRDELNVIEDAKQTDALARSAKGDDVVVVPAFAGLGAPYWDMDARGAIFGLTRDSGKAEIVKATLESLALQTKDVVDAMVADSGIQIECLKVDGGAIANDYLAQYQADILAAKVERPKNIETTALGAAYIAGIYSGLWSLDELKNNRLIDKVYTGDIPEAKRMKILKRWQKAIRRVSGWLNDEMEIGA